MMRDGDLAFSEGIIASGGARRGGRGLGAVAESVEHAKHEAPSSA